MLVKENKAAQFQKDGYVIVEELFSPEEMAQAKAEARAVVEKVRSEGNELKAGVYVGLTIASPLFRKINADPRIVDVLEEIVGPNLEFWSDKVVFKSASVDFGSPWHQDWTYWKGANKFSVWLALDDTTVENGCMKLLPGSHQGLVHHGGDASEKLGLSSTGVGAFVNRLRSDEVDESKAVIAPLRAGGAIFFHDLTLHASFQNKSGKDRWAMISTYRDASKDDLDYDFAKGAFMARGTWTGKSLGPSKG